VRVRALVMTCMLSLVGAGAAHAQQPAPQPPAGGVTPPPAVVPGAAQFGLPAPPPPTVPGSQGKLIKGVAYAPIDAPPEVQRAIWAGNKLQGKPYVYGGGHARFKAAGYDCSGTVSFALNGAGLLTRPLDSSSFMRWGEAGEGAWITIYTNPGHAYVVIAGLRLDTSGSGGRGPRWRPEPRSPAGYRARHPLGL